MKNLWFLVLIALTSCMTNPTGRTQIRVQDKRTYEPVGSTGFTAEDSNISISYIPDIVDAGTTFEFINKTDKMIKLVWDESVYISPSGQSDRVIHNGVRLMERNASQPASMLIPKGKLTDDLVPSGQIYMDSTLNQWAYAPLCGKKNFFTWSLEKDEACFGQTFGYMITYEIDGVKKTISPKFKYVSKEPLPKTRTPSSN